MEQLLTRLRQATTRQEAETCLKLLWQRMSEINNYYRNKFSMDDPPAEWLELGKRIEDMRAQGVSPGDICKKLHIKKVMYLHLLTEYKSYQRRAVDEELGGYDSKDKLAIGKTVKTTAFRGETKQGPL